MYRNINYIVMGIVILSGVMLNGQEIDDLVPQDVSVGDAYVHYDADDRKWTIGTNAIRMSLVQDEGRILLTGFENRLMTDPVQYVDTAGAVYLGGDEDGPNGWTIENSQMQRVSVGGRPAVLLDFALTWETLRAQLQIVAHPGTSILRQWVQLHNVGTAPVRLDTMNAFQMRLPEDSIRSMTSYWMHGGTSTPVQGIMRQADLNASRHTISIGASWSERTKQILSTEAYVPWMAFLRKEENRDGWFVSLDWLGEWELGLKHQEQSPANFFARACDLEDFELLPGRKISLPIITLGVFHESLDNMGEQIYRWHYEYLWDYTNNDYYAKTTSLSPWVYCGRNLQEQFAGQLAGLNMRAIDFMRALGTDMIWDDAGWAKHPDWPVPDSFSNVFPPSYEGPDFAQTQRYLEKMGAKWLLWFSGRPSAGVMDTKVGSWGGFQWRTDAMGWYGPENAQSFVEQVKHFLRANPGSSFHTCDGGSTYSHQFEMQRLADLNYLSDLGRGKAVNHYFSYIEPPDKWLDHLDNYYRIWGETGPYKFFRQLLTVPSWYLYESGSDVEDTKSYRRAQMRRVTEIYNYLLRKGVAGRWSYVHHPQVMGDKEYSYFQRTSHDRKRAVIIPSQGIDGLVRVYPRGLLAEHMYQVEYETKNGTTSRTGEDLMARGLDIEDGNTGGLIYLGLPNWPRFGQDRTAPQAPSRVLNRRETNIGYSGIGIYWSPGADNNWVSHYEIQRGDEVIGTTAKGLYYFDYAVGWCPEETYRVRTVDANGNTSDWTTAMAIPGEPLTFSSLGGHFPESGREGWAAETSSDGRTFTEMTWVPPAKNPQAALGGTPNQPGGMEGYWEGVGQARVGRGWQQASADVIGARVWRAPVAGTVQILGRAMKEYFRQDKGQPCRLKILHGDRQIWPKEGWAIAGLNDYIGAQHDLRVQVAPGDAIRFVLDRVNSTEDEISDIIAWMPKIVYVDQENAAIDSGTIRPVRILCGAQKDYTDSSGNVWSADRYYTGGNSFRTTEAIMGALPAPTDQVLYQHGRQGREFTYSIPVGPGLYSLRLKFTEPEFEYFFGRPFNLEINGREVIRNHDICHISRGPRRAYDRVFRYLVPDRDGNLVLRFTSGWEPIAKTDMVMVQAIEIMPEQFQSIRVNVGSGQDFVDWNSSLWMADPGFSKGKILRSDAMVEQASPTLYDQQLYRTARSGENLKYTFSLPPGIYAVHLKFAELWLQETGQRPMNISINGRCFWQSWDPSGQAGRVGMSADVRAEGITPDQYGKITLQINSLGTKDAILQAIQIE